MNHPEVAVVVGVGPGLGAALGRRFAKAKCAVALIARSEQTVQALEAEINEGNGRALGVAADAADARSLAEAFARIRQALGPPGVLIYNAAAFVPGGVLEVSPDLLHTSWQICCLGALLAVREVLVAMRERRRGTILFTGAPVSLRGSKDLYALAIGKFGLRALAQGLAQECGPQGIHVAHVIVHGAVDNERTRGRFPHLLEFQRMSPDAIAEVYWQLHLQSSRAWTHELDLYPADNPFAI